MNELTKETALAAKAKELAATCGISYSEALTTILQSQTPPETPRSKGGKKQVKYPPIIDFLEYCGYSIIDYDPRLMPKNKLIQEYLTYCTKQNIDNLPSMQAVDKLFMKSGLGETAKDGRTYYTFIATNQF